MRSLFRFTQTLPVATLLFFTLVKPVSAATPVAWFKADAITGVSSGSSLSTWADVSGNGYNATQTTTSQQPTYVANAMNGEPVVRFNNINSTVLTFNRPVQDDFTIVCVFQSTQGLNSGSLFYQGAGLVNAEVPGVVNDFGSCLFANGSICAGTGNPDVAVNSSAGYNDGRPHIMTYTRTRSTGLVSLYVDGVLAGTINGGTASLTSPSKIALGAQQTALYFLTGDIAEVQVYNSALSATDQQTAESQLFQKYSITPSVPTGIYLQPNGSLFTLNWSASSGATGYYVLRSTTANGTFAIVATNSTTSFTDTTASPTNIYYYAVAAYSSTSTSANSVSVSTLTWLSTHDLIGPSARTTAIAFSEIMYKPAARTDGKNVEFIELYNSNPWFQDISGYQITCADMHYTFPVNTSIPGGSYLVVSPAPADITSVYGITNVMGPYTGSLKKSETLQLLDEQGAVLLTVPFSDIYPWPVAADGEGHSIVLANPTYGEGDPRAWDISDSRGGSPGHMDSFTPSPLRNVVINEILPHSENTAVPQFIELYNHSASSVDISGCILTDDASLNKFVIPNGTIIGPAGFISFNAFSFTLNGAGGTVYLLKPDASRILDAVQYGPQANGVSYGRWPDGANDFYAFTANTPGTNNSAILIGDIVINELMYDPISGNDDDQYIELYNKGTNTVNLNGWQFSTGVTFTFPNVAIAPGGYLVVARNMANLFAKYPNLNSGNTVGNYTGKLSHSGELLTLAMPQTLFTNTPILVAEDQVAYGVGGRWGEWSHAGGSSLELVNPFANHRLAANWADSDETSKSSWTNIEFTGTLDNGANYGSSIGYAQIGLIDVGECLVDNIEVHAGNGANLVLNPDFESGNLNNWSLQGDHIRSSLDSPGYGSSSYALHMRTGDHIYNGDDSCQMTLAANTLAAGQTGTLRFKARWLHGWPEVLLRLNGDWLEATGPLPVPANLGSPGIANSRGAISNGPAIYNVTHVPAVPAAHQSVVVTANASAVTGLQNLTLYYRLDPATSYTAVPMNDGGTNGDAVPHDGIFSATIPGQAANQVVAFYLSANGSNTAISTFPAVRTSDNEPVRECVIMFGDGNPGGSFGVYHLWLTQSNITRWANLGNLSNEGIDCTMVSGNRVIYNAQAHFAGSPVHQDYDFPNGTLCSYKWIFNDDDKFLGATSFNKIHVPGNTDDDPTIQREQLANTFLRALGVPWLNRRYVAVYVNGARRGPLMEDAQTPDGDTIDEHYPNDTDGWLFKVARWYEFSPTASGFSQPDSLVAEAMLLPYPTSDGSKKLARYRWNYENRRAPGSENDCTNLFSLIDAASSQGSPNYVANLENLADMENWMRVFAANHAAGNWDCFGSDSGQNLYMYEGTLGTKWSLEMFDFNIGLGIDNSYLPGQSLFTTLAGDTNIAGIYNEPAFRRMYWRALQELTTNGPLNLSLSLPLVNAKYAAFVANGLNVEDPNLNLIPWVSAASASIISQVAAADASSFYVNSGPTIVGNVAYLTGQAPFAVNTIWVNGKAFMPTWTSITNWSLTVPLATGTNTLILTGVNRNGQPISGDTGGIQVIYSGTNAPPAGQLVINEIMYAPVIDGAQFVELYNNSTNTAFDLSGWQLQGLAYTFPTGAVILPTNFLVLAANRASFAAEYGATNPVFDTFSGTLSSSGEMLSLIQQAATNATVDQVLYQSVLPWPTNANGTGSSLQLIDPRQDNWRPGNWNAVLPGSKPAPQWTYVTATGTASSSTFYIYLQSAGDVYVDDIKLVAGSVPEAGANVLADGDFESGFPAVWTVSANLSGSALSTQVKHSGNASLHVVATSGGTTQSSAIWQTLSPALTSNATYTLSFWYLQSTNGGPLTLRLSGSGIVATVNPAPPAFASAPATPGLVNSDANSLPIFPTLWLNEVEPDNISGLTNSAGQRTAWLELYNPGSNVITLTNLYLANNYTNLLQWAFPTNATIAGGQFKVIFADGLTNLSTTNELHSTFTLTPDNGSLALTRLDANGQSEVLDFLNYNGLASDHSYGSFPDGQSFFRQVFYYPTPGAPNNGSAVQPPSAFLYNAVGSIYSQNFDALPDPGAISVNCTNPVTIDGLTYALANPFDFAFPQLSAGNGGLGLASMNGWYGYASVSSQFGATDGDQTTGGVLSFGLPNDSNRSLGLLATSSTGGTAFGLKLINATGTNLNYINVQFTGEVWRQSDTAKALQFYYVIDPTTTNVWPAPTAFLSSLNVNIPTIKADKGGVPVTGTNSANQINRLVSNQSIVSWTPGSALWLVWQMVDNTGKAQGLGIDNFVFSATPQPVTTLPPVTIQLSGGNVLLNWPTISNGVYRVQYKANLTNPTWTTLGSDQPATGAPLLLNVDSSTNAQRYYRVLLVN